MPFTDNNQRDELPDLFGSPKDPLREVYRGRWNELPPVQKIGVVVVILFCITFGGSFVVYPLVHALYIREWSSFLRLAAWTGGISALLATFYWALVQKIR